MREIYVNSSDTNKVNTSFGPMSYIDSGIGPALVFIHGWPMQKETFLPITRILQKDFRCISFNLIDIGESRPSTAPTPLSFHQQVAALNEAISTLGLEQYALVSKAGAVTPCKSLLQVQRFHKNSRAKPNGLRRLFRQQRSYPWRVLFAHSQTSDRKSREIGRMPSLPEIHGL